MLLLLFNILTNFLHSLLKINYLQNLILDQSVQIYQLVTKFSLPYQIFFCGQEKADWLPTSTSIAYRLTFSIEIPVR